MIKREHYLKKLRPFYDTDLIKIITGIRRSGKSVILEQIMNEIKTAGSDILYLNFEDGRILAKFPDASALINFIDTYRKENNLKKLYIFLDEIQEVEKWEIACKTIRLTDGNSLFITGSNSKLLSKEYVTEFSGRYISLKVTPFVYEEILEYSRELGREQSVMDYLIWGGFPKRLEFREPKARDAYLRELNQSIVENDLIVRYNIQNAELFSRIVNFVLQSNSRIFSARSIESYLKNEHIDGSVNTIIKYLGYLEEAYIIDRIRPYSTRTKTELVYSFKLYDADVSLNSIRVNDNRYDLTHNLENIIYNELAYRDFDLKVYNDEKGEIDFVATRDGKKYYIQVAYSVAEEKAYNREMKAFESLDNNAQKILITNDEIDYSTSLVKHIRFSDFVSNKVSL